jgi:hypothetical protein
VKRPTAERCATCGEHLAHDGIGFVHMDGGHIYGHVADPGEAYRASQRALMDSIRARNADAANGRTADL